MTDDDARELTGWRRVFAPCADSDKIIRLDSAELAWRERPDVLRRQVRRAEFDAKVRLILAPLMLADDAWSIEHTAVLVTLRVAFPWGRFEVTCAVNREDESRDEQEARAHRLVLDDLKGEIEFPMMLGAG
jgi:hypothetical protein